MRREFALEVHPTEIAFDIYSAERALQALDNREEFGFNFDPSHLIWQGVDPAEFIRYFPNRIHVHMKDAAVTLMRGLIQEKLGARGMPSPIFGGPPGSAPGRSR